MRPPEERRALAEWGWSSAWERVWTAGGYSGDPARVIAVDRGSLLLQAAGGTGRGVIGHRGRGDEKSCMPTVGDWCAVTTEGEGCLWRIHSRLPRRSVLCRRGAGRATLAQDLAANVDTAFLVCGLDTDRGLRSLARLLAIVLDGGVNPVVLLNKMDLYRDVDEAVDCARREASGLPVLPLSALTGQGIDGLAPFLAVGTTVALIGPSGSGKSTLVNALRAQTGAGDASGPPAATAPVRDRDGRGRHTTTRRQLHRLPGSGLLLDTPGLRELGVWADAEGLRLAFGDVQSLFASCRFSDCRHDGEPGCAVRPALMSGELEAGRFHRFIELSAEADSLLDRRSQRGRLDAKRRSKQLSKEIRRFYRSRDFGD